MSAYVEDDVIKKPNHVDNYGPHETQEFIKCATDVLYFIENYVKVQHPTKGALPFKPYPYQKEAIANFGKYRNNVLLWSRQLGKSLDLDTPILTPLGFVKMGDLKVGDKIYGADGKETTVSFITDTMYNRPCYKIEFSHGEHIVADADHLWTYNYPTKPRKKGTSSRQTEWIEKTGTTLELLEDYEKFSNRTKATNVNISCPSSLDFKGNSLELHPYVLGLWLGDGSSTDGSITSTYEDYISYKEILNELGYEVLSFRKDKRKNNTGCFTIRGILPLLKSLGVYRNKHIPRDYVFSSKENREYLIQGLMDTDGWISPSGHCEFYQSNKIVAETVRFILSTLGIKSTIRVNKTTHKDSYRIKFCTTKIQVSKLDRKNQRQTNCKDNQKNNKFYIKSITKVESVPVRCLQVDNKDHLFLCGETLIPTHNTTVAAGYLLHFAMFNSLKTVLIVGNKLSTAIEIMDRIKFAYKELPNHIRDAVVEFNKTSIVFKNGSKIVCRATSADAGRGLSISLLYCDEAAFVRSSIQSEFWGAINPILATGGNAIVTSTPGSSEDEFAQLWRGANDTIMHNGEESEVGKNGYKGHFAKWSAHPERDQAWADAEYNKLGDIRFRREMECEFISLNDTLIDPMVLARLEPKEPVLRMGEVRWYKPLDYGSAYYVFLDPSLGVRKDSAAIQIIEVPSMKHVGEWASNTVDPAGQVQMLYDILNFIHMEIDPDNDEPDIYWSYENNGIGEAVTAIIENAGIEEFPGTLISEKRTAQSSKVRHKKGLNTTNKSKLLACSKFKSLVDSDRFTPISVGSIKQLKDFSANGASYSSKGTNADDLVMSLILCFRLIELTKSMDIFDPELIDDVIEKEYREPMGISFGL